MRSTDEFGMEVRGLGTRPSGDWLVRTDAEDTYIELRRRLAVGLKEWRRTRLLRQRDVARAACSSQSRVAKMEAADPSVTLELLIRTLLSLGASRRDLAWMIYDWKRPSPPGLPGA